jgi:hypothetical protein
VRVGIHIVLVARNAQGACSGCGRSLKEKDINSLQDELFPLCVILYPALKVDWNIIRLMFKVIRRQIQSCLSPADICVLLPSLDAMTIMFSPGIVDTI